MEIVWLEISSKNPVYEVIIKLVKKGPYYGPLVKTKLTGADLRT